MSTAPLRRAAAPQRAASTLYHTGGGSRGARAAHEGSTYRRRTGGEIDGVQGVRTRVGSVSWGEGV
eukprot:1557152-Prymnesium_polylepis.1